MVVIMALLRLVLEQAIHLCPPQPAQTTAREPSGRRPIKLVDFESWDLLVLLQP